MVDCQDDRPGHKVETIQVFSIKDKHKQGQDRFVDFTGGLPASPRDPLMTRSPSHNKDCDVRFSNNRLH